VLASLIASLFVLNAYAADPLPAAATQNPAMDTSKQRESALGKGLGIATDKINAVGQSSSEAGAPNNRAIPTDGSVKSDSGSVTAIGIVGGNANNKATEGGKATMDIGANSNVSAGKDVTAIGIVGGNASNTAGKGSTAIMGIGKNDGAAAGGNITAIGIVGKDAINTADKGGIAKMAIGQNSNVMAGKDITAIGIVGGSATNDATGEGSEASMRIGANGR
jgi:hypothetical protein